MSIRSHSNQEDGQDYDDSVQILLHSPKHDYHKLNAIDEIHIMIIDL